HPVLYTRAVFNESSASGTHTLSLHDALPIYKIAPADFGRIEPELGRHAVHQPLADEGALVAAGTAIGSGRRLVGHHAERNLSRSDRKSTRLNSSHDQISYAVFCLKKKKNTRD